MRTELYFYPFFLRCRIFAFSSFLYRTSSFRSVSASYMSHSIWDSFKIDVWATLEGVDDSTASCSEDWSVYFRLAICVEGILSELIKLSLKHWSPEQLVAPIFILTILPRSTSLPVEISIELAWWLRSNKLYLLSCNKLLWIFLIKHFSEKWGRKLTKWRSNRKNWW
jgi:hypothetical protein